MRIVKRVLSTYSADNFGVCSALYELGGLVVMHDASGCNSTYNTHDEPRWYNMDSLVFISGLTEKNAIFGNDDKLISDLVTAAHEFHPRFIAVCGGPLPHIIGTDFRAVAKAISSGRISGRSRKRSRDSAEFRHSDFRQTAWTPT